MTENTHEAMRSWLEENPSVRADICREINSYDGSMDFTEVFEDIESAIEELDLDAVEAARMTFFGDVGNWYNAVYIDAYGNFADAGSDAQSYIEDRSEDYIDEIIDFVEDNGFDELGFADTDELEEIYLQDNGEDDEEY